MVQSSYRNLGGVHMILALDLSSKSSGYAVGDGLELIDHGCITSASTSNVKRIIKMRDGIAEVIKKYNITEIVTEEVRTDYKNAQTYKVLNWVQGAVVIAAYEINPKIEITYIQPSSWRAAVGIHTGRGIKRDELKKADIKHVEDRYGILVGDDEADAIGILDAYVAKNVSNEINFE
jgi:Holliday junction resolvasome RuvABC endonuclease subunit